ncbi:MAG: allantoinase AllB [Bacteroidia bacterium]
MKVSNSSSFALHSSRVLTENGLKNLTLIIKDGKIADWKEGLVSPAGIPVEDLGALVIMPGIIDSHVHINEPGRTEWEGFETMTQAAVAGGITTLVDMPLNATPVTTTVKALKEKMQSASGKLYCHCGFWGGLVPGNTADLEALIESGVLGIKAFLTHSGIDDFPNVSEEDLRQAMPVIAGHKIPLLAHAELDSEHAGLEHFRQNPKSYKAFLGSRPKEWEDKAIALLISLSEEFNCRVHIVHLSSAGSIEAIKMAREHGLHLTVETCPHYLFFCAEDIPDGNTLYKCTPPIREYANNEELWKALKEGTIDFIVTDHSPSTPDLKKTDTGNLKEAWGGIAGIQFSLPVVWTAARKRGFSIKQVSDLMSARVADFIGYGTQKGYIRKGYDADVMVWDPSEQFKIKEESIRFRHKITPYLGLDLFGSVKRTYVGGVMAYSDGQLTAPPSGKILLRT